MPRPMAADTRIKVLVAEKLADSGVDALREHFDVDLGLDWSPEELADRIGAYDGLLIRSATQVTADLISRAGNLKVIGRAGIGVDNVDVEAATKRGIVVANAPQSNIVAAAEHTIALMLAVARNVPRAHASLIAGRWERSKLSGAELYEKTLGVLGFGRIGQLVAARARGFGMKVVAYDPFVTEERYRELGAEKADTPEDLYARADFITLHLPRTPETRGILNADAFSKMKDGVYVVNCARGELIVDEDLQAAIDSGKVAGAGLDVFHSEPITEHPLFSYPQVVVTPHLGASTAEAQDRAGVQTAEQVVAALTGGVVSTAVNIPAISAEDQEILGPFVPLCRKLGTLAMTLAEGQSVERIEIEFLGRVAERDTRFLTLAVLMGALSGRVDDDVNLVNAPSLAEDRGIAVRESREPVARDFSDLVRVTLGTADGESVRVVGTLVGRRNRPHLLEAWGQRFNLQLEDHVAVFRHSDQPGMIGRVGTLLGERGVNIGQMVVGRHENGDDTGAVMVLTTDGSVDRGLLDELLALDGFTDGRAVELG
ncbi:MAG: D-3-phosphoglycerate dehydrogenase / 2-oxoglutarate reductase [Solirubrobacteraceae bacterium]|nr:D-3-phosphoglycerate dehydrogenase / 2-oxoglutarate reductase [Solirubrobacteraceae bacterium]